MKQFNCIKSILKWTFFLFFLLLIFSSCKKDLNNEIKNDSNSEIENFLKIKDVNNKELKLVIKDLEKQLSDFNFTTTFLNLNGQPLWDNALKFVKPNGDFKIYIPTKKKNENFISTFIAVQYKNENFHFELHCRSSVLGNTDEFSKIGIDKRRSIDFLSYFDSRILKNYYNLLSQLYPENNNKNSANEGSGQFCYPVICNNMAPCLRCAPPPMCSFCFPDDTNDDGGGGSGGGGGHSGGGGPIGGGGICPWYNPTCSSFNQGFQYYITDSIPNIISTACNNKIDSLFNWGLTNNFREQSFVLVRKNGVIYTKNYLPGTSDGSGTKVNYLLAPNEELVAWGHTHSSDTDFKYNSFFSFNDINETRRHASIPKFSAIVECGNKRFVMVLEDPTKLNAFLNINRLQELKKGKLEEITYGLPNYNSNAQQASIDAVISYFGSSSVCGLAFYEATSPNKTIFTKLNP